VKVKKSTDLVKAAIEYTEKYRFSVIPVKPDKKPYIRWQEFQKRRPTLAEIETWWRDWPEAMIGIVTGSISNLLVIDCDSQEGFDRINDILPDSLAIPTVRTPRGGWHLYFRFPKEGGVTTGTNIVGGVDIRGEGGYVVAPPSGNGQGCVYHWQDNLGLDQIAPTELDFQKFGRALAARTDKNINIYREHAADLGESNCLDVFACEGNRDNALFHVANCLVKGGAETDLIKKVIGIMAKNCCPPFPENEIESKIRSALQRSHKRETNLAQEVRDYTMTTNGYFSTTDVHKELQVTTKPDKKNITQTLLRLYNEGVLERHPSKNGHYRLIEKKYEIMDFRNAPTVEFELTWPLEIEKQCKIYPGNIIVLAGEKSAGKTCFMLNVVKENMNNHEIVYLNSEMGESELKVRLKLLQDVSLSDWRFTPIMRQGNWADLITADKKIWIIDYLEIPAERLYTVADEIRAIHAKLKEGICIIGLQKVVGRNTGRGDTFSMEKSRLYLALERGCLKIVDAKAWRNSADNPRGKIREFKLINGSKFLPSGYWKNGESA